MPKKIISFSALKGGVGKTTILFNLATIISKKKKILIIDLDIQKNITNIFLKNITSTILNAKIEPQQTNYANIQIIAGDNNLLNKSNQINIKSIVDSFLNNYDYILIDTAFLNTLTQKTLLLSDSVLIISDISQMSINGISTLLENYKALCINQEQKYNVRGIIINNLNNNKLTKQFINQLENHKDFKKLLIQPYIKRWTCYQKTTIFNKSLTELKFKKGFEIISQLKNKLINKKIF